MKCLHQNTSEFILFQFLFCSMFIAPIIYILLFVYFYSRLEARLVHAIYFQLIKHKFVYKLIQLNYLFLQIGDFPKCQLIKRNCISSYWYLVCIIRICLLPSEASITIVKCEVKWVQQTSFPSTKLRFQTVFVKAIKLSFLNVCFTISLRFLEIAASLFLCFLCCLLSRRQ